MKRKDTIIIITSNVSVLAFGKEKFKEHMEKLASDITYYAESIYCRWSVDLKNVTITDTCLENDKIVRFIYSMNSVRHNSNYENSVAMKMCLNLQKVFNSVNLIDNGKNYCFIDKLYNSRLDK